MKRPFVPSLALSLLVFWAAPALAQVHGALNEARVVPVNGRLGAGYLQFDKSSATLMGQLRLSFYPNLDFGFLGGLSRVDVGNDTQTSLRLAGDFRGQLAVQGTSFPVNLVLGGTVGVESADDFTILSVGPTVVVSRQLDAAGQWMGYGGASLLLSRVEVNSVRDTDTSFPVRAGLEFLPNRDLRLLAEAQIAISDNIRDDFSFTLGALFPF